MRSSITLLAEDGYKHTAVPTNLSRGTYRSVTIVLSRQAHRRPAYIDTRLDICKFIAIQNN